MADAVLILEGRSVRRAVRLSSGLDVETAERAMADAHAWIKTLRHARVDGEPLRRRFRFRNDSLWWFAEIYLHKQQVVLELFRTIAAIESLIAHHQPAGIQLVAGSQIARLAVPQVAAANRVRYHGPSASRWMSRWQLSVLDLRARRLHATALGSRLRPRRSAQRSVPPPTVAAFVHRAFWRADRGDGSAEAYIGPVLEALEQRAGRDRVEYVGVGPSSNFRARRWWHALRAEPGATAARPIEAYAPLPRLNASRRLFRRRHALRRALWLSQDVRERAIIGGCDCWPLIRNELAGIALLQWPWSARAMDEAAAALDTVEPRVAVTYAEAGGWGRALILECRRRGIPGVGLQHGFIHRHWLNYLHEADEMAPDPDNPADRGFPRPDLTLLFDRYAASHLEEAGGFPRESLLVSGSPRLDALVREAGLLTDQDLAQTRASAGAADHDLVLVVTKHREARHVLRALIDAAAEIPGIRLAIKTHPAETPELYSDVVPGHTQVSVLPASAPLAPLLRASRAVVTVNSTVALDAAVLDIPALVIGLPNNLSPFVAAGIMAGAQEPEIGAALRRILYDEEFRQRLGRNRTAFLARFGIGADGRAAVRAADAVLDRARPTAGSNSPS